MKIYIIGAGCVGSILAKHLFEANINVRFVAKGERGKRLEKEGITVNGVNYFIPLAKEKESPDYLFVCVKNFDLEQACRDMSEYIDERTVIIPLLNSVSPTPVLKEFFPQNRVLYGYITKIDAYKECVEYKYNISGEIHFGDANNLLVDPVLEVLRDTLESAGFEAYIDEDMVHGVWKKWMLNVGANQVSALTEADYLQFAKIPEIEKVLRLAMQELLTIACYEKVNLSVKDVNDILNYLTTYPYPKRTSMLQDILHKRRTEIDYISGDIIKFSRKWNIPCPVNLTMFYLIKSKEKMYLTLQVANSK